MTLLLANNETYDSNIPNLLKLHVCLMLKKIVFERQRVMKKEGGWYQYRLREYGSFYNPPILIEH